VDVDKRAITFKLADGSSVRETYDLCVGADGTRSAVRAALQAHDPALSVVVTDSGREYKTYTGLRGDIEPEGVRACVCVCGWVGRCQAHQTRAGRALRSLRAVHAARARPDNLGPLPLPLARTPEFKQNPGATLHLWTTDADAWTTLTAHSNPDGTYRWRGQACARVRVRACVQAAQLHSRAWHHLQ
jgi:2-polyprenyl-6-methoxyphenol hydroxylase-like FAD-dependent oxidoreductase